MSKKPDHEIRLGAVKASVWINELEGGGTRHNVRVMKIYKDDQDKWATTNSFSRDDLPLLVKVTDMAHTWIYQNAAPQRKSESAA